MAAVACAAIASGLSRSKGATKKGGGATPSPLAGLEIRMSGLPRDRPDGRSRKIVRLFGCFRHHVHGDIFAAELAVVEHHAALIERKKRVVLADADIAARVELRAALTD